IGGEPFAVKVVGSIHGGLFLVLVPYIVYVARRNKWTKSLLFFALISTTLPFGMFALERKLKKNH
ncbi:MAG: DUF3817 domain-containing protein, partial [Flavobacterium sp.]|nr:DUF3817 domain-containing protein [Flavobacterium sp.]